MSEQLLLPAPFKRNLSQTESLALVQIFLNVSLACISHTRELIPWISTCFQTRYIHQIDPASLTSDHSLYSAFQTSDSEGVGRGQEVRVLARGGHRSADRILDLLEYGVFEALQRGYLDRLQVFVTNNTGSDLTILETYHFCFSYDHGRVHGIQLSPPNHTFVLENFQKSFKAAIRALLRSLQDLPRLPARRKLGMSLTYTEHCPVIYQPPGFVDKGDLEEGEAICETLREDAGEAVGTLETGSHHVRVGICLHRPQNAEMSVDWQDAAMSRQLQAMQKTSSVQSTILPSTMRDPGSKTKRQAEALMQRSKRQKTDNAKTVLDEHQDRTHKKPERGKGLAKSTGNNIEEDNKGRPGVEPVTLKRSWTPKDAPQLLISKKAELLVHCYAIQCGADGGSGDAFDKGLLAEGIIKRQRRSNQIKCECGSRHRSKRMLFCEVCDCWQHRICYGYDESSPNAAPSERYCYTCLLYPGYEETEYNPPFIILMRRAVRYLTSQGRSGLRMKKESLQKMLEPCHLTKQTLDRVLSRLEAERILLSHGEGLWEIRTLDQSELKEVEAKYISAFAFIGHLFESRPDLGDSTQRRHRIACATEACARGQDLTTAQGCEKVVTYNHFGEPIARWVYLKRSNGSVTTNRPSDAPMITPQRCRKVSISRTLIDIDRSPSAADLSSDKWSSQHVGDAACNTDFSTGTSTATAD
ncbi:uncharacterized protein Z518_07775 [Rhinocladiella mackenziei CBS 650.93]|uniref:Rhinocladiella mackenziei CBS 650.93 unplaced genomic scaffold supercont1.5, whole genome shotgun sequence n=1 Tax=Rhinocladiella mackenziei CBS 650.93 TaxID=1442369 RepID=A0A0D2IM20_9EURO|nr:uncharacterized protein Z518_07775 [Rhinocladiella mackenziei CBS 650.93]KIX04221.1 hypothetical protein Z518_07775 [Rhinocladiella mackenziei CBS 650.93]